MKGGSISDEKNSIPTMTVHPILLSSWILSRLWLHHKHNHQMGKNEWKFHQNLPIHELQHGAWAHLFELHLLGGIIKENFFGHLFVDSFWCDRESSSKRSPTARSASWTISYPRDFVSCLLSKASLFFDHFLQLVRLVVLFQSVKALSGLIRRRGLTGNSLLLSQSFHSWIQIFHWCLCPALSVFRLLQYCDGSLQEISTYFTVVVQCHCYA